MSSLRAQVLIKGGNELMRVELIGVGAEMGSLMAEMSS